MYVIRIVIAAPKMPNLGINVKFKTRFRIAAIIQIVPVMSVLFFTDTISAKNVYNPYIMALNATKGVIRYPLFAISAGDRIIKSGFDRSDRPKVEGMANARKYFDE